MNLAEFDSWLRHYGSAWEEKDAEAFGRLFSEDARYYWTPLDPPKRGRGEICRAFDDAVSTQRDIHFFHEVLSVTDTQGIARWKCRFQRRATDANVRLDGVLTVRMGDDGLCREFREWWHSSESPPGVSE